MDAELRQKSYGDVKAAQGAYGSLRQRIHQLVRDGRTVDAAALAEMVLVRGFDDWYVGDSLPNVRQAIRRFCDVMGKGKVDAEIRTIAGLLAQVYAKEHFDDVHSHELCRTLSEGTGILEGEAATLVRT